MRQSIECSRGCLAQQSLQGPNTTGSIAARIAELDRLLHAGDLVETDAVDDHDVLQQKLMTRPLNSPGHGACIG